MENPATWNEVEKTIHETMVEVDKDFVEGRIGLSYVKRIYEALKAKDLLKEI